jgi:hypothetical protein
MKIKIVIMIVLSSLMPFFCCFASTYYLSTTGNDSGSGSLSAPWSTFSHAFTAMSGGDTLIVKDGTYNQAITNPPSGTPSAYTIIEAEHDGLAILSSTTPQYMLRLDSKSYVQVIGFKFINNAVNGTADVALLNSGSSYNKILRCGFYKTPTTTSDNISNVIVSGSHNLLEDCWAWGGGRYKFLIYGGDSINSGSYNILRRCVARHDREYSGGYNPQSTFCNYQGANNTFQNCITIDSNQTAYYDSSWYGAFFLEKGSKSGFIKLDGCIALNYAFNFIFDDTALNDGDPMFVAGNLIVNNSLAYDGGAGFKGAYWLHTAVRNVMSMDHCLIGKLDQDFSFLEDANGAGFSGAVDSPNPYAKATNNIFLGISANANDLGQALYNARGANDYNCFYNNAVNYAASSTVGAHDKTATNPLTTSLFYPVRIEAGGSLKGAGSSGSDIGPTILKRIGLSGTLYGEAGYDTVTADELWPFPNEDRIKNDMMSYSSNWPSGNSPGPTRGFCSGGNGLYGGLITLTSYIWEYLGKAMPPEIYNVNPPSILAATVVSTNNAVLSWADNSSNESGFKIERKTGSGGVYSQIAIAIPNSIAYIDSGLDYSTTYYYRVKAYNSVNDSLYSNEAFATIGANSPESSSGSAASGSGSSGGGGGGCFIATASFGTPMAKEVIVLSKFRDKYLLTNNTGREFIKFYYKTSPPIAKYLEKRGWAKIVVRDILRPIIWCAEIAVGKS